MKERFFTPAPAYKEMCANYTKQDGYWALGLYAFLLLAFYAMGWVQLNFGLYLGVPISLLLVVLCALLVKLRGQSLETVGITKKNLGKSLRVGLIVGLVLALMNVIPSIVIGQQPIPISLALYNVFYYIVVISLTEEIIFRGYMQTRISGLIKNEVAAVIVVGVLFYAMHLPFQMQVNGMTLNFFNIPFMVLWHTVFVLMYRKHNNLSGAVLAHALMDYGGNFFR